MTIAGGEVHARWLPALGCLPGAVDLMRVGPMGPIAEAVTLPEALMVSVMIDLRYPASNWIETVSRLAPDQPTRRRGA